MWTPMIDEYVSADACILGHIVKKTSQIILPHFNFAAKQLHLTWYSAHNPPFVTAPLTLLFLGHVFTIEEVFIDLVLCRDSALSEKAVPGVASAPSQRPVPGSGTGPWSQTQVAFVAPSGDSLNSASLTKGRLVPHSPLPLYFPMSHKSTSSLSPNFQSENVLSLVSLGPLSACHVLYPGVLLELKISWKLSD